MAINKVNYGGQTLIDTSVDTADASDVKAGETFHSKTGAQMVGTMVLNPVPAGVIQLYGGEYAPPNWLFCDGSAVSRTDYAALYAAIGTVYGAGDGSTTFNLPDFRGRGPLGIGLGNAGGATNHILGEYGGDERLQEHSHSHISSNSNQNVIGGGSAGTVGKAGASGSQYSYKSFSIGNTGEGQSGNMSPYIGINFIISTGLDLPWNSGTTELPIVRGVLVNGQSVVDNGIADVDLTDVPDMVEMFNGTIDSSMTDGFCYGKFDKLTRVVEITISARKSSDFSTSQVIATIPAEYRPSETKYGTAMIMSSTSTGYMPYRISLDSSGQIKQNGTGQARGLQGVIFYTI